MVGCVGLWKTFPRKIYTTLPNFVTSLGAIVKTQRCKSVGAVGEGGWWIVPTKVILETPKDLPTDRPTLVGWWVGHLQIAIELWEFLLEINADQGYTLGE